ncbi:chemotaxis protein CheW [Aliiroseovarius marinus]|uniref:chemotaxis protein CheA n=1 Tax=Aliiroseovarius marinus TaxID=2500159 RepID=UPI003D7DA030
MSDPMAEIKASFFIECEELLEGLQDGLQMVDDGESDDETINVIFRAVHSIKGGAGAFGLDQLVEFAHRFETVLDDVRSNTLAIDGDVLKLFFTCGDILADLVRECRDDIPHDIDAIRPVIDRLGALIGAEDTADEEEEIEFQPMTVALDLPDLGGDLPDLEGFGADDFAGDASFNGFQVKFEPHQPVYENGSEPLFMFRALRDVGDVTSVCDDSSVPPLAELSPEQGCLSWTLTIETTEPEDAVKEAFEFADGISTLEISALTTDAPLVPDLTDLPEPDLPPLDLEPAKVDLPPVEAADDAPTLPATDIPDSVNSPTPEPETTQTAAPDTAKKPATKSPAAPRATVRVDLERIDRLVNLVGELVINQAMISQSVDETALAGNSNIRAGLEEFLQLTRDIQDSVMMIRAQPVKSLFQRMGRIVREASSAIDKDVRLRTEGENTEVDKTVIERLADPLTHMIRNAVDHGLENNDTRVETGKSPEGNIYLTAAHRSGRVVIEVADDGAGINREKVKQKAIDKGLIAPDLQLTDSEIDNLLFLPGFSTADEVSNLSGRGVGMDVVRSAIQALGGRITISSQRNVGTTFSISLPLTLAVLDGMVVKVADETLVVPLNSILETLTLTSEEIREFGPETSVINIRDSFVPLLDLGAELGYRDPKDNYEGSVVLLIAHEDGSRAAVITDRIEDQRQVVIKGLQDSYGRVPGIAAATILGDGQIALILDPVDLITHSTGRTRPAAPPIQIAG